jgi:hypothetical protein
MIKLKLIAVLIVLSAFATSLSFSAETGELVTIFTISETEGQFGVFSKAGKPLDKPTFSSDKTSSGQFIQMRPAGKDQSAKYYLITNTGTSEVLMQVVGKAMVFFLLSDEMHSTLTICLDRLHSDGTFLVVETLVRPDAFGSGVTLARVFHGKAKPSPLLEAVLSAKK